MAGSFSDYTEKKVLDHLLKTTAWSPNPTSLWIALGDTGADDTGLTNEFTVANNYARKEITVSEFGTVASSRSIANDAIIQFNTASGAWGTPSNWGIFDASTAGNMIAWGTITGAGAIGDGDTPSFAVGEVQIDFNAGASGVGWSDTVAEAMLDHIFFGAEHTPATNLYVGFATGADFTDAGAITNEDSGGGGYARVICNAWDGATGESPALADNTNAINFTVSGSWDASVVNIFIANHSSNSTNAELLFFGKVTSFSAVNGDTVQILAGELDITLA